ncbi:Ff.00g010110.m01.CDS01 [Fusarium sp. VM40]|nr:Ff.00g010110.m01.CDS01 [Fusarium sp. VM40]
MNKKRGAPADGPGGSSSKVRKMENATKFYAVKTGRKPGVYLNYDDCKAQTTGFSGAAFKSFKTRKEAQDYIEGKVTSSAANGPAKFYAVAVGSKPGIYHDWAVAQPHTMGASKPKYKKFNTQHEAEAFIRENATPETCEALGLKSSQARVSHPYTGAAFEPAEPVAREVKPRAPRNVFESEPVNEPPSGTLKIYTDGSSLANGQAGSRAGLGVYFGRDDERNHSERLPGEPQTNQRAELMAMLRALEIAPLTQDVQILTDSQYSIKCATVWAVTWERKNWETSSGGQVKNQDIIRDLLAKMKERTQAGATTTFQWVKGHANDPGNNEADRLANIGSRMPAVV